MKTLELPDTDATARAGHAVGMAIASWPMPVVLGIDGHLGAGKTTLVRALAGALGIAGPVTSPTFTLERRYARPSGGMLRHWDFYRLDEGSDLEELGFFDRAPGEILAVEWWDRFAHQLDATEPCLLRLQLEAPDLVATPDRRVLRLGAGATAGSAELLRVVSDKVGARV